jgi:transcriptional regulator with XRE-family HTH domain
MIDLRAWRAHTGRTQISAAQALGVTERHYRRLETGRAPITRTVALLLEQLGAYRHHRIE